MATKLEGLQHPPAQAAHWRCPGHNREGGLNSLPRLMPAELDSTELGPALGTRAETAKAEPAKSTMRGASGRSTKQVSVLEPLLLPGAAPKS